MSAHYVWTADDHRPTLVLELVHREPHGGWYCLACSLPWPCPTATGGDE